MTEIAQLLPPQEERPLVTFALFAYNQEKYIREAVEGAFSQTYEPLEIIISDDCSTDKTFEIISSLRSEYAGPHRVVIRKNIHNMGIGSHLNQILGEANGELIVLAAGDDISIAERIESIVTLWLSANKRYDSIWSAVSLIDQHGREIGRQSRGPGLDSMPDQVMNLVPNLLGCSHATTKRLFRQFGNLNEGIVYEDRALGFRSLISGGHGYIDDPLVKYRIHDGSISHQFRYHSKHASAKLQLEKYRLHLGRVEAVLDQFWSDYLRFTWSSYPASSLIDIKSAIDNKKSVINAEILLNSMRLIDRVKGYMLLNSIVRGSFRKRVRNTLTLLNPLLPFFLK